MDTNKTDIEKDIKELEARVSKIDINIAVEKQKVIELKEQIVELKAYCKDIENKADETDDKIINLAISTTKDMEQHKEASSLINSKQIFGGIIVTIITYIALQLLGVF